MFILIAGGLLCEIFMKIPGKLLAPGYTDIVKNPITIPQIQQKFRAGEYPSIEEFKVLDCRFFFKLQAISYIYN